MFSTLLATKLHRPSPLPRMVQRPQLIQRLNEGLAAGRRLTLVSAPAGFGKTSCVSEWLNGLALPAAWLSLDPIDDDPGRFFAYLVAALQRIDDSLGRDAAALLQAGQLPPLAVLTTALLNDIVRMDRRFILVLDDFHLIHEAAVLDEVGTLISGQPEGMHLVLITREDPLLPLARLRANNQLTEIRAADLRFSESEAGRLLNELMDLSLSEADVSALEDRTEGWVAGLQLAGLSMRGRPDRSSFIAGLSGSHRYILSYLTEEVLDRQPPDIRDFLLRTSILERLTAPLCDELLEDEGGRTVPRPRGMKDELDLVSSHGDATQSFPLERLCAANLFLIPLDEDGEWYRYHHLFGQLLRARLGQTMAAGEIRALHGRASDWLAGHGHTDEAIRHALEGQDFERAVALVDRVARGMIFAGRMHTLRSWIAAFPPALRAAYPRLEVYDTWIALLERKLDFGEKAAQEREAMLQALPRSPENDRLRVELTAVLCRYSPVFGDPSQTIRLAEKALAELDEAYRANGACEANEGNAVTRARLMFGMGVAHSLEGRAAEAAREFEECLRLAKAVGDDGLAAEVLGLVAQDRAHCGHLSEATRLYQMIVDLPGQAPGKAPGEPPVAGLGYLGLAGIYLERYELERAEASLERGMALCARSGLDGIYSGYGIRSRLAQARGDLAGALAEIEAVERTFRRGDDPLLATRRILVARAMGDTAGIARPAEPWIRLLDGGAGPGPRPPALVLDVVKVLVAEAYLALGENERGLELLGEVETGARQDRRFGLLIRVYLLKALARQARYAQHTSENSQDQGAMERGLGVPECVRDDIERALELAEPEGYALVFLEEAPAVAPLLGAVVDDAGADERVRRYAERLLTAIPLPDTQPRVEGDRTFANAARTLPEVPRPCSPAPLPPSAPQEPGPLQGSREPAPIEPLSGRELEILRLIGEGYTNQEIAGRLTITLHTVKKHSSNIFGKLGVTSRTQAVSRARRLGLLE